MNLSNSTVSDLRGTTFVFTFKIKTIEGKRKVTGLISGMCKKHAKEEAIKIINDFSTIIGNVNSIKIVNIQRIYCDFLVVPKEEKGPKRLSDLLKGFANGTFDVEGPDMFRNMLRNMHNHNDKDVPETPLRDTNNHVDDLKTTKEEEK